ncbi:MAG: DedA family protein [Endomicrobiales bacterium]
MDLTSFQQHFIEHIYLVADAPASLFAVMGLAALGNTFFPPIPIEAVTILAGYLASTGHGSLAVIIAATTLGMFLGSMALFFLVRYWGSGLLLKPPFNRLVDRQSVERASAWFQKYGIAAFFFAKFVPGMNFCAVFAGGILRMGKGRAVLGIFLSNLACFTGLAYLGFLSGEKWREVYAFAGKTGMLTAALVVLAALCFMLCRRFLRPR